MELKDLLAKIEEKIVLLGTARNDLQQQLGKLKLENESLYKINKTLQVQIDECNEKNKELQNTLSVRVPSDTEFRDGTRQRITELVKEIDECIQLINK